MNLGEKIQHLRKEKNYTQSDLADMLYVSRAAISKWETGKGNPNLDSLQEISKIFGISINELLSNEELISIAVNTNRHTLKAFSLYGYGLLDLFSFMLMFFPLFGLKVGDFIKSVTLFNHDVGNIMIISLYYGVFAIFFILFMFQFIIARFGLLYRQQFYILMLSIAFSFFSLLVFIVTNEPYISFFLTVYLIGKLLVLLNFMHIKG